MYYLRLGGGDGVINQYYSSFRTYIDSFQNLHIRPIFSDS